MARWPLRQPQAHALHGVAGSLSWSLYPLVQLAHTTAPARENVPASQGTQGVEAFKSWSCSPPAHGSHRVAFGAE